MKSTRLSFSVCKHVFTLLIINAIWWGTASQSQAQVNNNGHKFFQTHLRLGTSLHDISTTAMPRLGATVGLVQELHFFPWLQLRAEGNVLWHGSQNHFWQGGDVDYFSVNAPVMLQIRPAKNFYIGGGVGVNYLVYAHGGEVSGNRLGFNWLGLVHYRFFDRVGLEVRWNQRFQQLQSLVSGDNNNNAAPAFDDTSLQVALTVRF
jgi:hypothetical protein